MGVYRPYIAMFHSIDSRCQDEFESNPQPFVAYLWFFPRKTLHEIPVSGYRLNDPVVYEKCGEKEEQLYVTHTATGWMIATVGMSRANKGIRQSLKETSIDCLAYTCYS